MEAFSLAGLDLPLKVVVWEENERVMLAYVEPSVIAARYDVTGKDALIAGMTQAFEAIVASVSE
jgi:uncharacterized protein (DUF302 family)